jgi:plastocyanin
MSDSKNGLIIGLIIVAAIAIIMSSVSLVMLSDLNSKTGAFLAHEAEENIEVGAPGVGKNEFYIFTQELDADEDAVGVPVAVYTLTEITVHKGDTITINFINPAEEPEDRHTFTMQAPYEMNYDIAGGESTSFTFTATTIGTFTYYCTYDLPSMVGQLVVLP